MVFLAPVVPNAKLRRNRVLKGRGARDKCEGVRTSSGHSRGLKKRRSRWCECSCGVAPVDLKSYLKYGHCRSGHCHRGEHCVGVLRSSTGHLGSQSNEEYIDIVFHFFLFAYFGTLVTGRQHHGIVCCFDIRGLGTRLGFSPVPPDQSGND